MIKLYNTAHRRIEKFKPINPHRVSIYSCGPTVYSRQHIGNLRKSVFDDILKRTLTYNGYITYSVTNITDVGHLVSDEDQGEDKIQKAAKSSNTSSQEIAQVYTNLWLKDLNELNVIPSDHYPRATEYIRQQINLIKRLEKKGFTYRTLDGIYFDTKKLPNYGEFAHIDSENLKAGERVSMGEKKTHTDFALWKFSTKLGDRDQEWDSPWGIGFPGWHSECVVMSDELLHAPFDIHTGGKDHIPIHHTNEIAQYYADTGNTLAHYWMHSYFLTLDQDKMSKSKGTILSLDDIKGKGYDPLDLRLLIIMSHYRSDLAFSWEAMHQAKASLHRLRECIYRVQLQPHKKNPEIQQELRTLTKTFRNHINNDLDTPQALAALFEFVRFINTKIDNSEPILKRHMIKAFIKFDRILGLNLVSDPRTSHNTIPENIISLAKARQKARQDKDFKKADQLRDEIYQAGFDIKDTPKGYTLQRR